MTKRRRNKIAALSALAGDRSGLVPRSLNDNMLRHYPPIRATTIRKLGRHIDDAYDKSEALVKSIKELGVLVPIILVRESDGTIREQSGRRRILAAIKLKQRAIRRKRTKRTRAIERRKPFEIPATLLVYA